MKHVIMYSGGIGSWMTARTIIERHGEAAVTLLFADVKGKLENIHCGEDDDCYRFISETALAFGASLKIVEDGRNIWDVFKDRRYLGNSRQSNCSIELKQKPCRKWLDRNCDPADTTVYVGIDWTETHRLPAIEHHYLPYRAQAPLTEPPHYTKQQMLQICRADGIKPPVMYAQGFPHANCQGACVKAGQAQWKKVLQMRPDTYAYHERQEQQLREYLGKDVTILRDHTAGGTPLTLTAFRERCETGQLDLFGYDDLDIGGCGCFTDYPDTPETYNHVIPAENVP